MHTPYKRRPSLTDPYIVESVFENDVLCGRDSHSTAHLGNKRFRSIIQSNCERYQRAEKRAEKTQITNEIIAIICNEGGRFLKFDDKLGCWVQVESAYIKDKISHALRSAKVQQKREGDAFTQSSDDEVEEAFQKLSCIQQQTYSTLLNKCHNKQSDGAASGSSTE